MTEPIDHALRIEPEPPEPLAVEAASSEHAAGGLSIPAGIVVLEGTANGARRSVGIAVSRFNGEITSRLLDGALEALEEAGVCLLYTSPSPRDRS